MLDLPKTLLWDQHTCLALNVDADVAELLRYQREGGALLSVNIGYSPQSFADVTALADHFAARIAESPGIALARTVDDVDRIAREDGVAVVFDLEDAGPLEGDLGRVGELQACGLRTLAPAYNHRNIAGGGCLDAEDSGLTRWGRDLVRELNAAGVVPDGSHGGPQTGMDLCAMSEGPVVYSHSCLRAVWDHPRNITDDQALACAGTGGVIGITGVGIFLGPNTPTLEAMIAHIEYAAELVGIDHVGVSTDFSFDYADFLIEIQSSPDRYDESYTKWGAIEWMPPERFLGLDGALRARGWSAADVAAVLGGNFRRVAETAWR